MKKKSLLSGLLVCALMFVAAGCSDNIDKPQHSTELIAINVNSTVGTIGDNTTKATLGKDGKTPNWEQNDKISVCVDDGQASEFSLVSGEGTANGTFNGKIQSSGSKMYFYYPASAANTQVDLSYQNNESTDILSKMVMFASADYSTNPAIEFKNKTSILKFSIPVPSESGWTSSNKYTAYIIGAYSMGELTKDGTWTNLQKTSIKTENISIIDGKFTGYAIVIPGSIVADLSIVIYRSDGNSYKDDLPCYITNYTNESIKVPENSIITINRALTRKALNWVSTHTYASWITDYISENGKDLTIVAPMQMIDRDFGQFKTAMEGQSNINLTLLALENLPSEAFMDVTALKSVSAPDLITINDKAFQNCTNITSVNFPKVTYVGKDAFNKCSSPISISLPKATSLSSFAFSNFDGLTSVSLPLCTKIPAYAFLNCTNLASIDAPEVTEIGDSGFNNSGIKSISLPKLTSLGWRVFEYCSRLSTVSLPQLTKVEYCTFNKCSALRTLELPKVTEAHSYSFDETPTIMTTLTAMRGATWHNNWNWRTINSVVTNLKEFCSDTYKSTRESPSFNYLRLDLSDVSQEDVNTYLQGNFTTYFPKVAIFQITGNTLERTAILQNCSKNIIVVCKNLTSLGRSAFEKCTTMTSLNVDNVETIGDYCLKNCTSLTKMWFPRLKSLNQQLLFGVTGLERAGFSILTDFTNAANDIEASIHLAFGATEEFKFASGKNPLVIFRDSRADLAAGTTLYLNENGYEYKYNVSGNKWRGVTFKEIKKFSEYSKI